MPMAVEKPDKRFHFKDIVSELALHAESRMIIFTSGVFIFLLDDNDARSASFTSREFFFFSNFTQSGPFLY